MIKPPINKNTYLFPYAIHVFSKERMPVNGKIRMGNSEVTPIGTTSLIHQVNIQMTIPNVAEAPKSISNGFIAAIAMSESGPRSRKINFFFSIIPNVLFSSLAAVVTFVRL